MTPYRLPYDSHRCEPIKPDANCLQCLRWQDLPGQTFGPRTPVAIGRSDSRDEACTYTPVTQQA